MGHLKGGGSGFGAAVVFRVGEATLAGLIGSVEKEDLVNDGEKIVGLKRGEGLRNGGGDVLGVLSVALEDDGEAKDGVKGLGGVLRDGGEFGGNRGDFKGAGNAKDLELRFAQAGLLEGLFGGTEHAVDVSRVVASGDDGKAAVGKWRIFSLGDGFEHMGCEGVGLNLDEVPHFGFFGLEIFFVVRIGLRVDGNLFDDFKAVAVKSDNFFWIVGEEMNFSEAEIGEDLSADTVFAEVGLVAEFEIGVDGVITLLLESVGANFGGEANAAAFLAHVKEDAFAGVGDSFHGLAQLAAAVATQGSEGVAGQAFAVDADKGGLAVGEVAAGKGKVVNAVDGGSIEMKLKVAAVGGQADGFNFLDEALALAAVFDEVFDGAKFELVSHGEGAKFGQAGHRAVVVHDFADDGDGAATSQASQVDGGFGMSGALKNAAVFGPQGENVPRLDKVFGNGDRVGQDADGLSAISGANSGGNALGGVDTNLKVGAKRVPVFGDHFFNAELSEPLLRGRAADKAAPEFSHKVDGLRSDGLGRQDEVALVFAVGVVHNDDHFAGVNVAEDVWDGIKLFFFAH